MAVAPAATAREEKHGTQDIRAAQDCRARKVIANEGVALERGKARDAGGPVAR